MRTNQIDRPKELVGQPKVTPDEVDAQLIHFLETVSLEGSRLLRVGTWPKTINDRLECAATDAWLAALELKLRESQRQHPKSRRTTPPRIVRKI